MSKTLTPQAAEPQDVHNLSNQFLIAMPGLNDPTFARSVTYICEHTRDGALGIIINLPMTLTLGDIYQQLNLPTDHHTAQQTVLAGGPVNTERGFILHPNRAEQQWQSTLNVSTEVALTASRDILDAMACGRGPEHQLMALGYAGWDAGQLEQEIADNAWLTAPADPQILFHTPTEQRWSAAAQGLGIDLDLISHTAGHA